MDAENVGKLSEVSPSIISVFALEENEVCATQIQHSGTYTCKRKRSLTQAHRL